jgi:cobalt/nickel transport system permease protein
MMDFKVFYFLLLFFLPIPVFSMHIMEGFLPPLWAGLYWALIIPFLILGMKRIRTLSLKRGNIKLLLAMAGAFAFILSALKLPSLTGSSSHATGVGLGTILFGPSVMSVLGFIVLLFQALLLAHGGLTTLGANAVSMAVAGPVVTWIIIVFGKKLRINKKTCIFIAAFLGNLTTYLVTSLQLAMAHRDPVSGIMGAFLKFAGIFAITQIPLAIVEGLLTVVVINILSVNAQEDLSSLEGGLL